MFRLPPFIRRFLTALFRRRPPPDPDRFVVKAQNLHAKLPEVVLPLRQLERYGDVRVSRIELTIVNHVDPEQGPIRVTNP